MRKQALFSVLLFASAFYTISEDLSVPVSQSGVPLLSEKSDIYIFLRESEEYMSLSDESLFTSELEGPNLVWTGQNVIVKLSYSDKNIVIDIDDISETVRRLELVCLIDTWLGESAVPFYTADQSIINSETLFRRNENPGVIISLSDEKKAAIAIDTKEIAGADLQKIILVNTGVFIEDPDAFTFIEDRSFSYFPDYINDSAVVLYFYPREISSESLHIMIPYLDDYDIIRNRYLADNSLYQTREKMIKSGLEEADKLIQEIDDYLAGENVIEDEELEALKKILEEQKETLHEYEKL